MAELKELIKPLVNKCPYCGEPRRTIGTTNHNRRIIARHEDGCPVGNFMRIPKSREVWRWQL